ncbi:hypothetical protein [Tateyamaria pelophila]|uniref:hypothetical protein n=1 Tax=Tateyamaria pelophila TaxID=328415 RepID=UPI001CBFBB79|nr:hypothetical protein [Tateyamaria pelophila]
MPVGWSGRQFAALDELSDLRQCFLAFGLFEVMSFAVLAHYATLTPKALKDAGLMRYLLHCGPVSLST